MTNKPTPKKPDWAKEPFFDDKWLAQRMKFLDREITRLDRENAQLDKRNAQLDKRIVALDKEAAERKAAHKEEMARLDKKIADSKVRLKGVEQEVGSLSDGTVLEEDIFHALLESRTICNIPLDNVEHDVKSLRGDQFDIVGTNGKYVVVIEIKRTLNSDDAARFAKKKKPVFEQAFASMIGKKKVLGAMIYRRANKKARTAAWKMVYLSLQGGF